MGSLLIFCWLTLYVVRWNTLNGKAGGLGLFIASLNCLGISKSMDKMETSFVLRGWHILGALFFLASLHLSFNANPMWTSKTLAAKEKERAAARQKKA